MSVSTCRQLSLALVIRNVGTCLTTRSFNSYHPRSCSSILTSSLYDVVAGCSFSSQQRSELPFRSVFDFSTRFPFCRLHVACAIARFIHTCPALNSVRIAPKDEQHRLLKHYVDESGKPIIRIPHRMAEHLGQVLRKKEELQMIERRERMDAKDHPLLIKCSKPELNHRLGISPKLPLSMKKAVQVRIKAGSNRTRYENKLLFQLSKPIFLFFLWTSLYIRGLFRIFWFLGS